MRRQACCCFRRRPKEPCQPNKLLKAKDLLAALVALIKPTVSIHACMMTHKAWPCHLAASHLIAQLHVDAALQGRVRLETRWRRRRAAGCRPRGLRFLRLRLARIAAEQTAHQVARCRLRAAGARSPDAAASAAVVCVSACCARRAGRRQEQACQQPLPVSVQEVYDQVRAARPHEALSCKPAADPMNAGGQAW